MDYAYRLINNVRYFYKTLNPASLSGAIDLIVVEQPDGSYLSTPFHVRFGKYGVLNSDEKYVDIAINGQEIDLKMKLGENGIAFFTERSTAKHIPEYLSTSPVPGTSKDPVDGRMLAERIMEIKKELSRSEQKRPLSECSNCSRSPSPQFRGSEAIDNRHEVTVQFTTPFHRRSRSLPNLSELSCGINERKKKKNGVGRRGAQYFHGRVERGNLPSVVACQSKRSDEKKERLSRNLSNTSNEESESDAESTFSIESTSSNIDHTNLKGSGVDLIRDRALSDSEIDRHRNSSEPHKSDVMVWKWGELPKTREQTENAKKKTAEAGNVDDEKKTESSWGGWFRWSRSKPDDQGVYLDDLVQGVSDPGKMEKYLGMATPSACPSSPYDSGNGSVAGLNSPPAYSDNENECNVEVIEIRKIPQESAKIAKENNNVVESKKMNNFLLRRPSLSEPNLEAIHFDASRKRLRSNSPSSDIVAMSDGELEGSTPPQTSKKNADNLPKYIRSLRLSSDKLKKLGLRKGANEAKFSITTKFQGTSWCSCHIYLFKWSERLVISDIDGTITKSDVLGHVIPAIGGQWAHAGVAELYSRIENNGYRFVYLSSRAIGQSYYTKKYLQSIAQDAKFLPDGPLLLSPTSVLMAFRREVIDRKPEEFKIAALSDLKECFPVKEPFYAGFGNRETDVVSYRAVAIPLRRILIIDKQGRVRRADAIGYETSFISLAMDTVDYMFPPLMLRRTKVRDKIVHDNTHSKNSLSLGPSFFKGHDYSDFTHWRQEPDSAVRLEDDYLEKYEAKRKILKAKKLKKH